MSPAHGFKFEAPDGKQFISDVPNIDGVVAFAKHYPNNRQAGSFTGSHIPTIERMPETRLDKIADKYVEMNLVHPFMEGNGRSTRICFDLMARRLLKRCVDWSRIDKNEYQTAMRESVVDPTHIRRF